MKTEKEISYWGRALYLLIEDSPKDWEAIFDNLKSSLGKKQIYLPAIIKKAEKINNKEKKAILFISHDFEREEIIKRIKEEIKGIDKVEVILDEDLLAGFRLKTKDVLIKASLKDALIKLKNKIYGYN